MYNILIAARYPLLRKGIISSLDKNIFNIIWETSSYKELLLYEKREYADVVIIEWDTEENSEFNIEEIHEAYPESKIVVIAEKETIDLNKCIKEKKIDMVIVLKDDDECLLNKKIKSLFEKVDSWERSYTICDEKYMGQEEFKKKQLTKREREVLILISEGLFNKEIASKLNITERTVKNHVSNLFKKIDVSDRTQAAVYAIKNNIIKV